MVSSISALLLLGADQGPDLFLQHDLQGDPDRALAEGPEVGAEVLLRRQFKLGNLVHWKLLGLAGKRDRWVWLPRSFHFLFSLRELPIHTILGTRTTDTRERAAELEALVERRATLDEALAELGLRERTVVERIRAFEDSDAYRAAKDLDDEEQAARRAASAAEDAARRAREDEGLFTAASAHSTEAAREAKERGEELERARLVATERAKDAALAGVHGAVDALAGKGDADAASGALRAIRAQRDAVVSRLRDLARELARAVEAHRRAEERAAERAAALEAAREALREAERRSGEAEEAWVAAAEAWLGGLRVLPREALPDAEREDAPDPAAFRAAVESAAEPVRRSIAGERAAAAARLDGVRADEEALREERDALACAPHPTPPGPAWRPPAPRTGPARRS